jgi:flavin-dependent dehydrogenase
VKVVSNKIRRVLIAGGSVAGASLAIQLGRKGIEVELYERAMFPREKPCGEGMMPAGVAVLERMGLAEAAGGVPFHGARYHFTGFRVDGRFPSQDGKTIVGRGQRRVVLDELLFQTAAATPGVRAHAGTFVDGPLIERGRVTGLIVEGEARRGDLVVAADGIQSPIRKALGLDKPIRQRRFGVRTHFRLAQGKSHVPWIDVFVRRGYEIYVTPLPENELLVGALVEKETFAGTVESEFSRWWKAEPELATRLEGAEQISPLLGRSPLSARARCGVAPGVVLLGDAGGSVDPITGGGMAQALGSAELLTRYVTVATTTSDAWMMEFERERNKMLRDYRMLTGALLWLAGHPRLASGTMRTLRATPRLFNHLVGVSGGVRRLWSALPTA